MGGRDGESVEYATASNTLGGVIWERTEAEGTASVRGEEEGLAPRRSPDGVLDLTGNVLEWMANARPEDYASLISNPFGPFSPDIDKALRSRRGGSWYSNLKFYLLVANRSGSHPGDRGHSVGFRLVLAPPGLPGVK